jgi:sulfonate transport system permease protein
MTPGSTTTDSQKTRPSTTTSATAPTGSAANEKQPHARADERVLRRRLGPGRRIPLGILLGPLALVAVWSAGSASGWIDPVTLSAPWTVVATAGDLVAKGQLQSDLAVSAIRAFWGLVFGVLSGTVLAIVAGLSRLGESLIDGPVQIKRSIPSLALIPLLILWFGIGEGMKVITIALAVLVPIYIHTHNGLRSIDSRYVELAETSGVGRTEFVRSVVLPGAMPGFLLGMRFAVTSALLALVVVEQINATSGIGYMITLAQNYGQTDVIVVGLVVYAALGLLGDGFIRLVQRRALAWRRTLDS